MPVDVSLPKAALLMSSYARNFVYTEAAVCEIRDIADIVLDVATEEAWDTYVDELAKVELLFTSWGTPCLNAETLALMPALRSIFYGAGSLRAFVTDIFWERNIPICSAASLNAIPVAEYALAQIILCLKQSYHLARSLREQEHYPDLARMQNVLGSYGAVVGLISLGQIARQLLVRLQTLDVRVQVSDPFLSEKEASKLGVTKVDLETLFSTSDVISLHTPLLPETEGMITGELLELLKPSAAFINTARGAIVDERALCKILAKRPDVQAVLDVTHPEPPLKGSLLYTLPNVFLTPHLAGSHGRECARMGDAMVREACRFLAGEPLELQVTPEIYARMA